MCVVKKMLFIGTTGKCMRLGVRKCMVLAKVVMSINC